MLSFILSVLLIFVSTSHGKKLALSEKPNPDDPCGLRGKYGKNYLDNAPETYWALRKKDKQAGGSIRLANKHNERYQEFYTKKVKGIKLTPGEKIEMKALDEGLSMRHATLLRLEEERSLNQTDKVELDTLKSTNGCEPASRLAIIAADKRSAADNASFQALVKTNCNMRAAYLSSEKARGLSLNQKDRTELEALMRSKGDREYAELKVNQVSGHTLNACEKAELTYLDKAMGPTEMVDGTAVKGDRLQQPSGNAESGRSDDAG